MIGVGGIGLLCLMVARAAGADPAALDEEGLPNTPEARHAARLAQIKTGAGD